MLLFASKSLHRKRSALAKSVQLPFRQGRLIASTFVVFCNSEELFHFSYRRYLENCLRDTFGFAGTPIRMVIRQKGDETTGM